MKKFISLIAVFIFLAGNIFSQDLRKKAESNPLDCALYLSKEDTSYNKAENLANTLFDVGRYENAIQTIGLEKYNRVGWLVFHTRLLVDQGNSLRAKEYLDKTIQLVNLEDADFDEDILAFLAPLLVNYGRSNEALALFKLADDENKAKTAIGISRAFLEAKQTENALKLLPPALEIAEADQKAEIIELYARLKQIQKAENLLAEFESSAFIDTPIYHNKRFILFPLINANLALGKPDHALELWQIYGEKDDAYGTVRLTNSLIEFGYQDKANFYLSTMQSDSEMLRDEGANIVKNYLKLENTEEALKIAENMSEENDSYQQQQALKYVAEKLIADNKKGLALKVLEFAFQRAEKVIFEHESMQNIGASSGTRKVIYLTHLTQKMEKRVKL